MTRIAALFLALSVAFAAYAASDLRLVREGTVARLEVAGEPFYILGGELGNSSASCDSDVESIFPRLAEMGLNTVLVPAYWELIEPEEGQFDFSTIDKVISEAQSCNLKVVFLWFGAWKNSMSCYAPEWFKVDVGRFPRARTASGKPLEIASAFSPAVLESDCRAFGNLVRHIEKTDTASTVVMIQVENEIGMLEDARDHSALAEAEYAKGVPSELTRHLAANRKTLHPQIAERWKKNGSRRAGTWTEVFGDGPETDEYFMAWNYARYVERLAQEARKTTSRPLYVNAALNSRGRKPGEYPSAGPLAHLKDVWHAAAPDIDLLSPDIYDSGFEDWVAQYALPDNPLFIPEARRGINNGAQAYYVLGHHHALGISPFSIENADADEAASLRAAYGTLSELFPLLARYAATSDVDGVLLSAGHPEQVITDGPTRITLSHFFTLPWDPRARDKANWPEIGAILIKIAPDEYILAGSGIVAKFEDSAEVASTANLGEDGFLNSGSDRRDDSSGATARVGLARVEEVSVGSDGTLTRIRTLNGDETHQGRHARIGVDDHKILHIKTYRYK